LERSIFSPNPRTSRKN